MGIMATMGMINMTEMMGLMETMGKTEKTKNPALVFNNVFFC